MTAPRTSLRPWVIGFGLVAVGLIAYLLTADSPADAAEETAKRLAAGKRARPEADFVVGLWWAAVINLVLAIGLGAAARLWARPVGPIPDQRGIGQARWGRGFAVALLAIVALSGVMRWNLAQRSLWWDELWPTKFGIVGYYLGEPTDPLEDRYFGEANWQRALWHFTRPMNHSVASYPARLSHVAWRGMAKPEAPNAFNEFALRFPNWLASLGAVAMVGLVGALWGRPLAGLLAAFLLAIHPWHIRYGVDLRCYSWMVLWMAMGLAWLSLVFRSGRSRWWPWIGFGLNQGLLVWSFPHAIFLAAGFAIVALVLAWRLWPAGPDRRAALGRWFLANTVGAMLYLQLFGPNLVQMAKWLDGVYAHHSGHAVDLSRARELVTQGFYGMPWMGAREEDGEGLPGLVDRAGSFGWVALGLGAMVLLVGAMRLRRENRVAASLTAFAFVVAAFHLAYLATSEHFFYPRFFTYLLVPSVLLFGFAGDWTARCWRIGVLIAVLGIGCFSWLVAPQWRVLMGRPYAPMRDVAEAFDTLRENSERPIIFGCYGHGEEMMPIYFPEIRGAITLAELQSLAEEAETSGSDLVVALGYQSFNRFQVPDGFDWLDDPGKFEEIRVFRGIVPEHTFRLLKYRGVGPTD